MQNRVDPPPFRSGTGLLLVGHGTRDASGTAEFLRLAEQVAQRVEGMPVEPCFLEFASPSICEAFARLVAVGARHVVVAPVILFAAGHVRRDIPREVAQAAERFPGVTFEQGEHLGCHPALVEESCRRYEEALAAVEPRLHERATDTSTVLLLVGRGSRDAEATAEMHAFANLRQALAPQLNVQVAFLAMAQPPLDRVLQELADAAPGRVVVQPHLLFTGELLARLEATVSDYRNRHPNTRWRTTAHLGPAQGVVRAVLDRAFAAALGSAAQGSRS